MLKPSQQAIQDRAEAVAARPELTALDPTILLSLLQILLPLVAKWCQGRQQPDKLPERAQAELKLLQQGRGGPPMKARRKMKKHGVAGRADQDLVWRNMVEDAAGCQPEYFAATAQHLEDDGVWNQLED